MYVFRFGLLIFFAVSNVFTSFFLQDTQDALQETEVERNALRKQLARMSFKKPTGSTSAAAAAPPAAVDAGHLTDITTSSGYVGEVEVNADESKVELSSVREENKMLMDHLVSTKIRLAEVEGDVLESRRALLRSREKQMQLARQIMALQAVERQPAPLYYAGGGDGVLPP